MPLAAMEPNVLNEPNDTAETKRVKTAPEWSALPDAPCSSREAMAAAVVGTKVYLFGGLTRDALGLEVSNDLICYDTEKGNWLKQSVSGEAPLGRTGHTMTGVGNKCVVFGGLNHDKGYLADTHVYQTEGNEWQQPTIDGTAPRARDKHAAVAMGDKMVVFGGFGMVPQPEDDKDDAAEGIAGAFFFSWHNDTHILHTAGESMRWELLNTTGTLTGPSAPTARAALTAVNMGDKELVIFGGKAKSGRTNDVWKLDVEGCMWTKIDSNRIGSGAPASRSFQSGAAFEGKLYIFGGVNTANQHLNDLHVLDMEACSWREIGCTSSPKARGNMGAALIGSKMHVFCGSAGWDPDTNMSTEFFQDASCLDLSRT